MLYGLIAAAVAATLVELIAPQGEGGRLGGQVRLVAGLCILIALIQPLREGLTILRAVAEGDLSEMLPDMELPAEDEYGSVWADTLAKMGEQEAESWVESVLEREFGISPDNRRVQVICEAGEDGAPCVREVRIALWGAAIWKDPHVIEAHISERLSCPCTVSVGQ